MAGYSHPWLPPAEPFNWQDIEGGWPPSADMALGHVPDTFDDWFALMTQSGEHDVELVQQHCNVDSPESAIAFVNTPGA